MKLDLMALAAMIVVLLMLVLAFGVFACVYVFHYSTNYVEYKHWKPNSIAHSLYYILFRFMVVTVTVAVAVVMLSLHFI